MKPKFHLIHEISKVGNTVGDLQFYQIKFFLIFCKFYLGRWRGQRWRSGVVLLDVCPFQNTKRIRGTLFRVRSIKYWRPYLQFLLPMGAYFPHVLSSFLLPSKNDVDVNGRRTDEIFRKRYHNKIDWRTWREKGQTCQVRKWITQCGNFRIFLSLRFYVKSILWILSAKTAVFSNLGLVNLVHLVISSL